MLESRSAYGYYGTNGGATGDVAPSNYNTIERRMPYYKFKRDYPTCEHYGYDSKDKTIVVLIPQSRQSGNFGNKYQMETFEFIVFDKERFTRNEKGNMEHFSNKRYCTYVWEQKAKTYENAYKLINKKAKENGCVVVRLKSRTESDKPHKFVSKYGVESVVGFHTLKESWYEAYKMGTYECYVKCSVCGCVHLATDKTCPVCDIETSF